MGKGLRAAPCASISSANSTTAYRGFVFRLLGFNKFLSLPTDLVVRRRILVPRPTLDKHVRGENTLQIFTSFALVARLSAHDTVRIACDCSVLSMGDSLRRHLEQNATGLLEPPNLHAIGTGGEFNRI